MKNYLLLLSMFGVLAFAISCSDKDEPDPHEVGLWVLEGSEYQNFPAGFTYSDGITRTLDNMGLKSYTLEIKNDKSFIEKVAPKTGAGNNSDGTWVLTEGLLSLDYGDDDLTEFKVKKNKLDQLWISFEDTDTFLSDDIWDELIDAYTDVAGVNAYINSLDQTNADDLAELNRIFTQVSYDFVLKFGRSKS